MKWLTAEMEGVLLAEFVARFRRFGFGEAMDSRSWRTVVPWNPTSGGVGRRTPPASVRSTLLVSAWLPSDVDAWMMCAQETSINDHIFAVSSLKNLYLTFTSCFLLRGRRISACADLGSARFGRVEVTSKRGFT